MRTALSTLAFLVLLCAGCNVVGPAVMLAHGPEKTPAQFQLPEGRPVVVFIDDRSSYLPRRSLRQVIATEAGDRLLNHGGVKALIEPRAALAAVTAEQPGVPMDIVTLGKSVQAEIVVYATVTAFTISPDRASYLPSAQLRVKVIDVNHPKARIWPDDPAGHTLTVQPDVTAKELPRSPAALSAAEERLGVEVGRRLAELFYSHETYRAISDR